MNGYNRYGWAAALAALLLSALVGVFAYNLGVSHGLAQVAVAEGTPSPFIYGWHRPWGFGFGFPLLFLFFGWMLLSRRLWWGPWHGRRYYGRYGVPPAFDDWHRRAHEQMKEGQPADDSGRRG